MFQRHIPTANSNGTNVATEITGRHLTSVPTISPTTNRPLPDKTIRHRRKILAFRHSKILVNIRSNAEIGKIIIPISRSNSNVSHCRVSNIRNAIPTNNNKPRR